MISRYSRPEMVAIWSDTQKYKRWFEVEALVSEAQASLGIIPQEAAKTIRERGQKIMENFGDNDIKVIELIEQDVKHDVIAFLTWLGQKIGPEGRYLHLGLTSSDLLDTSLSLTLRDACKQIRLDIEHVMNALKTKALQYKYTPCIGRSHGVHAEPTTFGLKLLGFYAEFARHHRRLTLAKQEISSCKISGAVGTYSTVDPRVEDYVAEKLDLRVEPITTQVIPRDRHAVLVCRWALLSTAIERFATELRHLQRTEVGEVQEPFTKGQKGSSAMPHKRNPILCENLTGLMRLVKGAPLASLENVVLWHERDMSHSSVERVIFPDVSVTLDFALHRLAGIIEHMEVHEDRMLENLNSLKGLPLSQNILLALIEKGLTREEAYELVQKNAFASWEQKRSFKDVLTEDSKVTQHLTPDVIDQLLKNYVDKKNVDLIFDRVLNAEAL